jgi:hypothetical protein
MLTFSTPFAVWRCISLMFPSLRAAPVSPRARPTHRGPSPGHKGSAREISAVCQIVGLEPAVCTFSLPDCVTAQRADSFWPPCWAAALFRAVGAAGVSLRRWVPPAAAAPTHRTLPVHSGVTAWIVDALRPLLRRPPDRRQQHFDEKPFVPCTLLPRARDIPGRSHDRE